VSNPSFQSGGSELEAIFQGDRLINSRAVVEKKEVRQAVGVASFSKEQGSSVRWGVGGGVVEMTIAGGPLGVRCFLEEVRPLFNEEACLVPVAEAAEVAQVGIIRSL
jgi:hypothetical protein